MNLTHVCINTSLGTPQRCSIGSIIIGKIKGLYISEDNIKTIITFQANCGLVHGTQGTLHRIYLQNNRAISERVNMMVSSCCF